MVKLSKNSIIIKNNNVFKLKLNSNKNLYKKII